MTRRALLWALALVVTLVFGYYAVRDARPAEVWDALRHANLAWAFASLLALAAGIGVRALRWQYLFHARTRPPLGPVTSAMLIGLAVNSLLPFRAGEAVRIVALGRRAGTSRVEALGTVALERALDVFCLLALLLAALPWLPEVEWIGVVEVVAGVLAVALVAAALVFAIYGDRPFHALERRLARLPFVRGEWLENAGANLGRGLVGLRDARLAATALALTTLSWLFVAVSFWLLMEGLALDLPLASGILVLAAVGFSVALPAAPGGLGVFEAAVVVALDAFDVARSTALSYAFALHALNLFPYLIAGAIVTRFARAPR